MIAFMPTKRDQVFDLIIENDPLFSDIDVSLRAYGHEELADTLVKLIRDIGTEQFNDSFVNDIKDFGEEAVQDVANYSEPQPGPMTKELLEQYTPVSQERFSLLVQVAFALSKKDPILVERLNGLIDRYNEIVIVKPEAAPSSPLKFEP
jgi:hypothetical protein